MLYGKFPIIKILLNEGYVLGILNFKKSFSIISKFSFLNSFSRNNIDSLSISIRVKSSFKLNRYFVKAPFPGPTSITLSNKLKSIESIIFFYIFSSIKKC